MFIGHYSLGFAGKRIDKGPSLGTLFLAVQWLDLIWPILVLAGVEQFSIDPGNTVLTPLNFEFYPWSHSLLMSIIWGLIFAGLYYLKTKNRKGAFLLFLLVVSHWVLDWLTHRPDLPLTPFTEIRVGLGLWNHKWIEIILETLLFVAGAWMYLRATRPKNKTGTWSLWGLLFFLLLIHFMNIAGPPPPDVKTVAWMGLSQWLIVAWGFWIDTNRVNT
ncbi:MAG: hypothetical protein GC171_00140 [Terrimonas sp.]|nr:hypothetical protein [Terrimonas sp.]